MTKDALRKWMWVLLAALLGMQFYFVRELLSALLLLSMGFAAIFTVIAAVYLLHRAWESGLAGVRNTPRTTLGFSRRGAVFAGENSSKAFRRPRSKPVQYSRWTDPI